LTLYSAAGYRWIAKICCDIFLNIVLTLVYFNDEIKLKNREPEDDSNDEDWSHDQEDDNLEPDLVEDNDHVKKETEGEQDVGEIGGEPGDQKQVVTGDPSPGGQEVGGNQEDIDQDWQQEECLRVLIIVLTGVIILRNPGVMRNLLEMGLGVGEEDEVDDEEGGVKHEVGAGDEHCAGAGTQLQTRHLGAVVIISPSYILNSFLKNSQLRLWIG